MKYKVSPTLLDSYRSVRGQTKWEKSPGELINQIKGAFIPTEAMRFGTAIHKYIEDGESSELMKEEKQQLYPAYMRFEDAAKEQKIRSPLTDKIVVSMIADAVEGRVGHEFKTGASWYGVDTYTDSAQWKLYALSYDLDEVVYHHFQYGKKRPVTFKYRTFNFYPYVGMRDEMIQLSEDFIDWAIKVGVDGHLKIY